MPVTTAYCHVTTFDNVNDRDNPCFCLSLPYLGTGKIRRTIIEHARLCMNILKKSEGDLRPATGNRWFLQPSV